MSSPNLLAVLLLVGICSPATGKVYGRCELIKLLKASGMSGYRGVGLADWVCLTKWESDHNTSAQNHNTDGSTDYGIFQINSRRWCRDGSIESADGCGIPCSRLLNSDISDDIECAKRVVRDPNGIGAWVAWRNHCRRRDLSSYTAECGV
ncbi:lysozyme C-like [Erpetoichthys calabaricus]|uniref:lysozyme n=1 Tax=Erpetoichthys calabaricus TaxID=27687 RepID=A0A8C4XF30_ERPCA|nr:lysozyme C-like [Erpetoichthys calabaricus]XP_051791501.1 lysozyme C-like [Erpetoichthys calabaricus]